MLSVAVAGEQFAGSLHRVQGWLLAPALDINIPMKINSYLSGAAAFLAHGHGECDPCPVLTRVVRLDGEKKRLLFEDLCCLVFRLREAAVKGRDRQAHHQG